MPKGFKIADLYAEITVDKDDLRKAVKDIPRDAGPDLDRSGREMGQRLGKSLGDESKRQGDDAGGKLAVGMRMSIVRNSPLIVAAIGGALAAGAPVALAGATALFAGIGIAAASQSVAVRSAWMDTWFGIRDGVVGVSGPIQSTLVGIAERVTDSFQRMLPTITGMFRDLAPQIDVFADGMMGLVENALPGFQRAIERGMPVTQGFASFLESAGTGLTRFLDSMSAHSPAAGAAFAALGDILENLLPILGELLGQGAELAAIVLPPLAKVMGVVADAAASLGPLLPIIVAGFTGMKIAQSVAGWVGGLGDKLAALPGRFSAMSVGTAAVTGALGLAAAGFAAAEQQTDQWAQSLLEGGAAAERARTEISSVGQAFDTGSGFFDSFLVGLSSTNLGFSLNSKSARDAHDAYDDLLASMDPVSRTSALLEQATNDLSAALQGEGQYAGDVAGAQAAYDEALANSEAAAGDLEQAINGVTTAMIDQANQALAAADSSFGYRQAQVDLENQMISYQATLDDSTSSSLDLRDAMLDLEKDTLAVATAAGQLASDSLPATTSELERQQIAASATLTELIGMRQEMGDKFPPALNATIAGLQASGATINGVNASTVSATGQVRNFIGSLTDLGGQHPVPTADLDSSRLQGSYASSMNVLGILSGQRPLPIANLNNGPLSGAYNSAMNVLGILSGQRPSPVATLFASTGSAEAALNYAARNRSSTVFQSVVTSGSAKLWTGGKIGDAVRGFADGGSPSRRWDGRLVGPGGPFDDLIPAVTNMGEAIRVANSEWIINGPVSQSQGDRKMAALNSGQADIVMRDPRRRFADGGTSGEDVARGGGSLTVNLNMYGADFSNPRDRKRIVSQVVEGIREHERSLS